MLKRKRYLGKVGILAMCCVIQLSGCSLPENAPIFGGGSLKENEALKVEKTVCSTDVAKLYVMNLSNKYKRDFGGSVDGKMKIGDMDFDKYIITKAQNALSIIYALSALAQKENIKLSDEENQAISSAAKVYVSELNNKEISFANIKEESVNSFYTNYYLADKYCNKKIENVSDSVSDEEARAILIQYIHIDDNTGTKEARKILTQVKKQVEGGYQDFLVEAARYSNDDVTERKLYKNKATEEYELEAFDLQNDQISDVIDGDDGLYLVKCVEAYLKTETDRNKTEIASMNKAAMISKGYDEFVKSADKQINEEAWKNIDVISSDDVKADNLLEIYSSIEE